MKGNQYMTNNIKTLSFNREQAENLYQDGMTNFASDDKYLKALGFFQKSVGGIINIMQMLWLKMLLKIRIKI